MLLFRKISFWLALAGLCSAGLLINTLRAQLNEPIPPPPLPPPSNPFVEAIGASGIVEALGENTALGVPLPGLVAEVAVKVWDRVEIGDPLLRLDDREARAALATLQAEVAVAAASLTRLVDQLDRLEGVTDPRAVAREEVRQRRSDISVARAQLEAAKAAVAQQESLLERLTVRAPRAGTILQVTTRAGEYLTPSSAFAPILLGQLDTVQIRADVDEQLAPRVRPGARAIGRIKGDPEHPIELTFARIEPYIIPKKSLTGASSERVDTRVLQVLFTCANSPDRSLYVGQQIDLFIEEPAQ